MTHTAVKLTDRGAGGKPKAAVGGGPVLLNHFAIVLRGRSVAWDAAGACI